MVWEPGFRDMTAIEGQLILTLVGLEGAKERVKSIADGLTGVAFDPVILSSPSDQMVVLGTNHTPRRCPAPLPVR